MASLPQELRPRYVHEMEAAERWELRIGALIEFGSRVKSAVARTFQTPGSRSA
ncbi:MAG TPA: hypothetical protein VG591_09720 [Burkholderiales bacterium]|nr:hypothetical protein [Burkholderiales bacterium]